MESKKMLDWGDYPKEDLDKIKVMSAYFVDIIYNHLYTVAKKAKLSGKTKTITDGYRDSLIALSRSFTVENYTKYIKGINDYFDVYYAYGSMQVRERTVSIANVFIPEDYRNNVPVSKKMSIVIDLLGKTINDFILIILREHMSTIIDHRSNKEIPDILQEILIDAFLRMREKIYLEFVEKTMPASGSGIQLDTVLIKRLRGNIDSLKRKNKEMREKMISMQEILKQQKKISDGYVGQLMDKNRRLVELCKNLKESIKEIEAEKDSLRNSLREQTKPVVESTPTPRPTPAPRPEIFTRPSPYPPSPRSNTPEDGTSEMIRDGDEGESEGGEKTEESLFDDEDEVPKKKDDVVFNLDEFLS